MATLYKRGPIWWIKFHHRGRLFRKSLRTNNRQLARERSRSLETSVKDGGFALPAASTRTPLGHALEEFCLYLRTTRTAKSAQTDVYYLRQLFGPACPAMWINARRPMSDGERKKRIARLKPSDMRPGRDHLRPVFIEDLTTAEVSRALTTRMKKRSLAPKTGNRLREILHRLCQWCISQRGVWFPGNANPVSAVERFREKAPRIRFLTLEQVHEQLNLLAPHPAVRVIVRPLASSTSASRSLWMIRSVVNRFMGIRPTSLIRMSVV